MTQRVIYPVSNPPAEDGEYLAYWKDDVESTLLLSYDACFDEWSHINDAPIRTGSLPDYWEEAPALPEFYQALVVGGAG